MTDLLFAWDNLQTAIYITSGETLAEISATTGVPVPVIVRQNCLTKEPYSGTALVLKVSCRTALLTPENFPTGEAYEKICKLNGCDVIYPFELVLLPDDI